jgi:hypothetical protein
MPTGTWSTPCVLPLWKTFMLSTADTLNLPQSPPLTWIPKAYDEMREKYRRILHYGVFSLPGKRAVANEVIWKWTEATGKYVGCQFWSIGAKSVFDQEVRSAGGWPITVRLARTLERKLSTKSRPNAIKLTHEHVYPIKDIKLLLASKNSPTREEIRELLERQCMSCVLLESEHDRSAGHDPNPWLRYTNAGNIRLADNPAWPDSQRKTDHSSRTSLTPPSAAAPQAILIGRCKKYPTANSTCA